MEWIHLGPIPPRDLAGLIEALALVAAADVILNKSNSKKMIMMMMMRAVLSFVVMV
jgi:hypothetical protein